MSGLSNSCKSNLLLANVSFKLVQHTEEEQITTRWTSDSENGVLATFVLCCICGVKVCSEVKRKQKRSEVTIETNVAFQRALERSGE